jgi:predicted transcriptional regulator
VLPPIEVNQHNILIDGFHRWTAHRKAEAEDIKAVVTQTASEAELYGLSIQRNAAHGLQMNERDKAKAAIRLYASGTGLEKTEIATILSVTPRMVNVYLQDEDRKLREERKQKIFDMWLACATLEEIAEATGVVFKTVDNEVKEFVKLEELPKIQKLSASFQDSDFTPPIYNVWSFGKKTNDVEHFGNSEQRILENLLYLYTEPFDIVVDPFAGGGATIDVCKKRLRRYWASDRKPIVERESEIRQHDIKDGPPPLNKRWSDVALTYLDPPYWRQAINQYSKDSADLANMALEDFTESVVNLITAIAKRQSKGAIALLMQPTQWNAPERKFTDHISDIIKGVGNKSLTLENRVSCPYSTEQCLPQMVEWAKGNKKLLVISRELVVWSL